MPNWPTKQSPFIYTRPLPPPPKRWKPRFKLGELVRVIRSDGNDFLTWIEEIETDGYWMRDAYGCHWVFCTEKQLRKVRPSVHEAIVTTTEESAQS